MDAVTPRNRLAAALLSILLMFGTGPVAAQGSDAGIEPDATAESATGSAAEDAHGEAEPAMEASEEVQPRGQRQRRPKEDRAAQAEAAALAADLRKRLEEAFPQGDAERLASVLTRRSVVMPITGETLEGPRQIARHFRNVPRPETVQIRSQRTDQVGRIVLDIGTISYKMPADAGGQTVEAEYVLLARMRQDDMQLIHLTMFPRRQATAR